MAPKDDDDKLKSEDAIKGLLELMGKQDATSSAQKIVDYFDQEDRAELNIAVTGRPGSGKSTLVNAVRGLGNNNKKSAKVGWLKTSRRLRGYTHPKYKTVKVWDLPGIKKAKFKADKYLKKVKYERYDFFIIITSDQFRESHSQLAEKLKEKGKPFYFVRSKIDSAIKAEKKKKKDFDEEKTLDTIRENCKNELSQFGTEDPEVFLISSRDLGKYDFDLLQNKMKTGLSQNQKRILLLSLPNVTPEIIRKKKKVLNARIFKVGFLSACVTVVPVEGLSIALDMTVVEREIKKYHYIFDINKKLLKKRCNQTENPMENMNDVAKRCDDTKSIVVLMGLLLSQESLESIMGLMPLLGTLAKAATSFVIVCKMLKKVLKENTELAKSLIESKK